MCDRYRACWLAPGALHACTCAVKSPPASYCAAALAAMRVHCRRPVGACLLFLAALIQQKKCAHGAGHVAQLGALGQRRHLHFCACHTASPPRHSPLRPTPPPHHPHATKYTHQHTRHGHSEVLDNANELRIMLCKDKVVHTSVGAKRGTAVIAACGASQTLNGRCVDSHSVAASAAHYGACTWARSNPAHARRQCLQLARRLLTAWLCCWPHALGALASPVRQRTPLTPLSPSFTQHNPPGIYADDIINAVPIDKYFELFKPNAGGEGGFIRLALDFVTDPSQIPKPGACGRCTLGGGVHMCGCERACWVCFAAMERCRGFGVVQQLAALLTHHTPTRSACRGNGQRLSTVRCRQGLTASQVRT